MTHEPFEYPPVKSFYEVVTVTTYWYTIGTTQEHLRSADLDEDGDETKRTGVVDSSSDMSRATE